MLNSSTRTLRIIALTGAAIAAFAAQPALAADTAELAVTADVTATCNVTTSPVAFGSVDVTSGSNVARSAAFPSPAPTAPPGRPPPTPATAPARRSRLAR